MFHISRGFNLLFLGGDSISLLNSLPSRNKTASFWSTHRCYDSTFSRHVSRSRIILQNFHCLDHIAPRDMLIYLFLCSCCFSQLFERLKFIYQNKGYFSWEVAFSVWPISLLWLKCLSQFFALVISVKPFIEKVRLRNCIRYEKKPYLCL